jgi:hypothetical protein
VTRIGCKGDRDEPDHPPAVGEYPQLRPCGARPSMSGGNLLGTQPGPGSGRSRRAALLRVQVRACRPGQPRLAGRQPYPLVGWCVKGRLWPKIETSYPELRWLRLGRPGISPGHNGGGCEIRTREGLPPTRFPTMLASVHRGPGPSGTWADCDGWVSADARESGRMRPHLSPAGPAGRCQQRGPHPAGLHRFR